MKHIIPAAFHFVIHDFKQITRHVEAEHDVFVFVHLDRAFIFGIVKDIKDLLYRYPMFEGRWFANNLLIHTLILAETPCGGKEDAVMGKQAYTKIPPAVQGRSNFSKAGPWYSPP
jgi:hypothetical protein